MLYYSHVAPLYPPLENTNREMAQGSASPHLSISNYESQPTRDVTNPSGPRVK